MTITARVKPLSSASCVDIDRRLDQLSTRMDSAEGAIQANRRSNQTLGYLGGLFLVPLIGLESNAAEKASLDAAQRERDLVIAERASNACPDRELDSAGRAHPAKP